MSLILDALKKSDQERPRKVPNLRSVHHVPTPEKTWRWLPLSLMAAAAGGLGIYLLLTTVQVAPLFGGGEAAPSHAPAAPAPTPAIAEPVSAGVATAPSSPPQDAGIQGQIVQNPVNGMTVPPPAVPPDATPVGIDQLEPGQRAAIEALIFSSHIYSEEAAWRQVRIDDRELHEGDAINPDMQLVRITESGVIVAFGNRLIAIDVVDEWVGS